MSDQALIEALQAEIAQLRSRNTELEQLLRTLPLPIPVSPTSSADSPAGMPALVAGTDQTVVSDMDGVLPDQASLYQTLERLQQEITERTATESRLHLFEALVENALDSIAVASMDGVITYANAAFKVLSGFGERMVGSRMFEYFDEDQILRLQYEILPCVAQYGQYRGQLRYRRADRSSFLGQISAFLINDSAKTPIAQAVIVRDITDQQQAEQVIVNQQAVLRELLTPLLPIAEGVVVMPIVGSVDSARAQQIMDTLLEGIATQQATRVILDITGVKVVDTEVANALIRVAQASQLLGAQVVLTGISPEVAQTLVHLAADLRGIVTRGTLQNGIAYALGPAR